MLSTTFGTTPSCLKSVRNKSSGGVFMAKKPLIFLRLTTMDLPGDIMARTTPPKRCLTPVSIGPQFIVMPMTWSNLVTLVNVMGKSRRKIKCPKMPSKFARFLTFGASISWGRSRLHKGTSTQVGDRVFLKVSPFRGVKRFGIKGKLSPRFIGPFEILERIGEVSYRLALPPQLSHVHDVFHVSLLRGYHYHPLHVASYPFDQIQPDMSLSEEPESILDRQERVMRNKVIPFVKILWKNHPEREATWETEESMRASYPHFFV
ncbi:putative nucleotidyltransferase, ribonuclease H [Tanacetum coccineum]